MHQKGSKNALAQKLNKDPLLKNFIDYVRFDTKADPDSNTVPSSKGQLELGAFIVEKIKKLNFDVKQKDTGVVCVKVPASVGFEKVKSLCLLAHLDTAPDASGKNVNPLLVENYVGSGIELENGLIIDDKICPELKNHLGDDIVVTDGTTLLGADDKAGVAVLCTLLERLSSGAVKHGPLTIIFSVDEELGKSCGHLDVKEINCDYGVTVDGCDLGEFDIATFNADAAVVTIKGRSVHTAVAKGKMLNALKAGSKFIDLVSSIPSPETTEGLEGFVHPHDIRGGVEQCVIKFIVRSFTKDGLIKLEDKLQAAVSKLNSLYGEEIASITFSFQYANMEEVLKQHPKFLDCCRKSFEDAGVLVKENFVRGGTDGSNLSNEGLPCPNIFTGGLCCHGPFECLPVASLHKSYAVVEALVKNMPKLDAL